MFERGGVSWTLDIPASHILAQEGRTGRQLEPYEDVLGLNGLMRQLTAG